MSKLPIPKNSIKERRKGRVLIDYNRNNRGSTSIVNYSTRARPGCPVAVPIAEEELTAKFLSHPMGIGEVAKRAKAMKKDPWEGKD